MFLKYNEQGERITEIELDQDSQELSQPSQQSSILNLCNLMEGSQTEPTASRAVVETVARKVTAALERKKVPQGPPKKKRHYYMNEESYIQKWQELEDEKEQKEYEKEQ